MEEDCANIITWLNFKDYPALAERIGGIIVGLPDEHDAICELLLTGTGGGTADVWSVALEEIGGLGKTKARAEHVGDTWRRSLPPIEKKKKIKLKNTN